MACATESTQETGVKPNSSLSLATHTQNLKRLVCALPDWSTVARQSEKTQEPCPPLKLFFQHLTLELPCPSTWLLGFPCSYWYHILPMVCRFGKGSVNTTIAESTLGNFGRIWKFPFSGLSGTLMNTQPRRAGGKRITCTLTRKCCKRSSLRIILP